METRDDNGIDGWNIIVGHERLMSQEELLVATHVSDDVWCSLVILPRDMPKAFRASLCIGRSFILLTLVSEKPSDLTCPYTLRQGRLPWAWWSSETKQGGSWSHRSAGEQVGSLTERTKQAFGSTVLVQQNLTHVLLKTTQTLMHESQLFGMTLTFIRCCLYELFVQRGGGKWEKWHSFTS